MRMGEKEKMESSESVQKRKTNTCIEDANALLKDAKLMKISALGCASAAAAVELYILITISLVPKNAFVVPARYIKTKDLKR